MEENINQDESSNVYLKRNIRLGKKRNKVIPDYFENNMLLKVYNLFNLIKLV